MVYETGRWYAWDGKQDRPECLEGAELYVTTFDTSAEHYWERQGGGPTNGVRTDKEKLTSWKHRPCCNQNVVAFYVVSYPKEQKEMTVAEIEKELGYPVKIVK